MAKRYTDEELIKLLQALAKFLGRTPKVKDVESDINMPSAGAYIARFGSWNKTLETAGFSPNRYYHGCTNEELIELLKAKIKSLGRIPVVRDIKADDSMPDPSLYWSRFGSWKKALEIAGFSPKDNRRYTDEALIKLLQAKVERLGQVPKLENIESDVNMPSATAYIRRFGSWNKALEKAGFSPKGRLRYTDDELIEMLGAEAERLGRVPKMEDLESNATMPSARTYANRFRSWNEALKLAGILPSRKRK